MSDTDLRKRLRAAIGGCFPGVGAQTRFAKALQASDYQVSSWLSGRLNIPQAVFEWFANNTKIRVEWILTGEGDKWKKLNLGKSREDIEVLAREGKFVCYRGEDISFEEIVTYLDAARRAREIKDKNAAEKSGKTNI
jgi:hypothetical protein